jgi:hypothetical protein
VLTAQPAECIYQNSGPWTLVAPHGWIFGIKGTVGAGRRTADVDLSVKDSIDKLGDLKGAAQLHVESGYRDVGEGVFAVSGVRAADSPDRRVAIKRHGPVNHARRSFFPVYDWNKARLLDEIRASGLRLSPEYRLFGRSFDGIDYRFVRPIRDHYPADYDRIRAFFPLIDVELHRYERRAD